MENEITEQWLAVPGYETYEVSNEGRVRSYRKSGGRNGGTIIRTVPRIIKSQKNPAGYHIFRAYNEDGYKQFSVHTMVLTLFVGPRPDESLEYWDASHVNHDKNNNSVTNLIWQTHHSNVLASEHTHKYKPVQGFNKDGELVYDFKKVSECLEYGLDRAEVGRVANGHKKHYKGIVWKFTEKGGK
jgi:hypothetical protein